MAQKPSYPDRSTTIALLDRLRREQPDLISLWQKAIERLALIDQPGGLTESEWRIEYSKVRYEARIFLLNNKIADGPSAVLPIIIGVDATLSESMGRPIPSHFAFLRESSEDKP